MTILRSSLSIFLILFGLLNYSATANSETCDIEATPSVLTHNTQSHLDTNSLLELIVENAENENLAELAFQSYAVALRRIKGDIPQDLLEPLISNAHALFEKAFSTNKSSFFDEYQKYSDFLVLAQTYYDEGQEDTARTTLARLQVLTSVLGPAHSIRDCYGDVCRGLYREEILLEIAKVYAKNKDIKLAQGALHTASRLWPETLKLIEKKNLIKIVFLNSMADVYLLLLDASHAESVSNEALSLMDEKNFSQLTDFEKQYINRDKPKTLANLAIAEHIKDPHKTNAYLRALNYVSELRDNITIYEVMRLSIRLQQAGITEKAQQALQHAVSMFEKSSDKIENESSFRIYLIGTYIENGMIKHAKNEIEKLELLYHKNSTRKDEDDNLAFNEVDDLDYAILGTYLIDIGEIEQAANKLNDMKDTSNIYWRLPLQKALLDKYLENQNLDQACTLINSIQMDQTPYARPWYNEPTNEGGKNGFLADGLSRIGFALAKQGNHEKSKVYFELAYSYAMQIDASVDKSWTLGAIAANTYQASLIEQ